MDAISRHGRLAWKRLHRMIVFPTCGDVAILAVGRRGLDFGADDAVTFAGEPDTTADSFRGKILAARRSMWPEGEFRKQFPRTAGFMLAAMEISRVAGSVRRKLNCTGAVDAGCR
jgi:hypothetical protein